MKNKKTKKPLVAVIMGSKSDELVMSQALPVFKDFGIPYEMKVVSAHRSPKLMQSYALACHKRGLKVIVAGAGGSAHLPGMVASLTPLPVIGVPVMTKTLKGLDSLLSIVQMPRGVPVATVAIDNALNAGLLAVRILATSDTALRNKLIKMGVYSNFKKVSAYKTKKGKKS